MKKRKNNFLPSLENEIPNKMTAVIDAILSFDDYVSSDPEKVYDLPPLDENVMLPLEPVDPSKTLSIYELKVDFCECYEYQPKHCGWCDNNDVEGGVFHQSICRYDVDRYIGLMIDLIASTKDGKYLGGDIKHLFDNWKLYTEFGRLFTGRHRSWFEIYPSDNGYQRIEHWEDKGANREYVEGVLTEIKANVQVHYSLVTYLLCFELKD